MRLSCAGACFDVSEQAFIFVRSSSGWVRPTLGGAGGDDWIQTGFGNSKGGIDESPNSISGSTVRFIGIVNLDGIDANRRAESNDWWQNQRGLDA